MRSPCIEFQGVRGAESPTLRCVVSQEGHGGDDTEVSDLGIEEMARGGDSCPPKRGNRVEGKPSPGTDPRGCSTGHCGGRSTGTGDGCLQSRWGELGRGGSQPAAGKVQPPQAFRAARPASHSQGGHRPSGTAGSARPETGRKAEGPGPGGSGGSARGCCRNAPRPARGHSRVGGSGGSPRRPHLRLCPPGHRSASRALARGWEVTGGQETRGATGARAGQPDATRGPAPTPPAPRTSPWWDAVPAPPRHRAPQTERATPAPRCRQGQCVPGRPGASRRKRTFPLSGAAPGASPGGWRGWGPVPELGCRPRAPPRDRSRADS